MAHSACKMHNPKFSYSQIKFPDGDIFGPDSFSLSEINWVHPFVGHFIQFHEKLKEEEKTLSFANKPIILSKVFAFCCWRSKYFFSQEGNVLFQVSLEKCKIIFFKIFLPLLKGIPQLHI